MSKRTVEVYTGAYASGKSETSINRALELLKEDKNIALVDLDTVEPAYCLRPIIEDLEAEGLKVVAQRDYFGLGEAASYVNVSQLNCLLSDNNLVIDVGYGAHGLDVLDILNGIDEEENLKIYVVINTSKFETKDVESILEYLDFSKGMNEKPWKKFSGIISNTHFADETTKDDITKGYKIIKEAAKKVGLPIIAIGADEKFKGEFENDKYDNIPVWFLKRHMPRALW